MVSGEERMLVHTFVASVLAAAVLVAPIGGGAKAAGDTSDEATIRSVLSSYEEALNASNTDAVVPLYAEDGVFMPPYSHSAIGKDAVRQAYIAVFKAITLHVKFSIAEVVQMSPEWAFVRTNSAGTNKVNATGAMSAEGNQELFIFKKDGDGQWKIARYSFSSTNPPAAR
jgi:uncharacterized protein (TIGR02246 family)